MGFHSTNPSWPFLGMIRIFPQSEYQFRKDLDLDQFNVRFMVWIIYGQILNPVYPFIEDFLKFSNEVILPLNPFLSQSTLSVPLLVHCNSFYFPSNPTTGKNEFILNILCFWLTLHTLTCSTISTITHHTIEVCYCLPVTIHPPSRQQVSASHVFLENYYKFKRTGLKEGA